jgi:hypothetical protein
MRHLLIITKLIQFPPPPLSYNVHNIELNGIICTVKQIFFSAELIVLFLLSRFGKISLVTMFNSIYSVTHTQLQANKYLHF